MLALRRQASPALSRFLDDEDFQVASEAARAIYDRRVETAMPDLARTLEGEPRVEFSDPRSEGFLRRAIVANLRVGDAASAERLIRLADSPTVIDDKRVLALEQLKAWDDPPEKETVWFDFWAAPDRRPGIAAAVWSVAVRDGVAARIRGRSEALRREARAVDQALLPPRPNEEHLAELADAELSEPVRADALRILVERGPDVARQAIDLALEVGTARMRATARRAWVDLEPATALDALVAAVDRGDPVEAQAAVEDVARFVAPRARFVRVELAGPERILSIAELQVWSAGENIAVLGTASQSSVGWDGEPMLAIDGDTDGDHSKDPSVTHTRIEQDPWWELDLGEARAIDRVAIYNRTDGGLYGRLDGAVILLLDEERRPLRSFLVDPAPEVSLSIDVAIGGELSERAADAITGWMGAVAVAADVEPIELEVVTAARRLGRPEVEGQLGVYDARAAGGPSGRFRAALIGGDADRGRELFHYDRRAECLRCHVVDGVGGNVGPDLTGVGARLDRPALLRSMVDPNATVTPGYGTISVTLKTGDQVHGVDLGVDDSGATLVAVGDELRRFDKREIRERTEPVSAMLAMGETLSLAELRDLVAYLASLDEPPSAVATSRRDAAVTALARESAPRVGAMRLVVAMAVLFGLVMGGVAIGCALLGRRDR